MDQQQILQPRPGPCPVDPQGFPVCPPPVEIVCIKVDKVYQECKQVEMQEATVNVPTGQVPQGTVDVRCVSVTPGALSFEECTSPNQNGCCITGRGIVTFRPPRSPRQRVDVVIQFLDAVGNILGSRTLTNVEIDLTRNNDPKTVRFSRAGERGMHCEVDIFLDCVLAFFEETVGENVRVHLCINELMVFKLIAKVQLMVPSYGFCPQPPECEEQVAGQCPTPVQTWPPYPPQLVINGNNEDNNGCGCGS